MLVPVDQEDDDGIVQQALHMAGRLQCHIHLLYHPSTALDRTGVDQLKTTIRQRHPLLLDPAISLEINTDPAFPERQIIDYSKRHSVDLILLVRKKRAIHPLFRSGAGVDHLVDKTRCPVLTVSGQPILSSLKNIVLPIGSHLPMRKLLFATYLGKTVNSTIHLVAPGNSNGPGLAVEARDNLHKCYRLLKENTNLSIECQASPEENLAEAAWDYAKKIKADLILTTSGKESMLSGFWNHLRSRFRTRLGSRSLSNTSQIPVMTISGLS